MKKATIWAVPVLLAAALIGAGCGDDTAEGDSGGTAGGSTAASDDRAAQYAACMRKNGVPEFPDPENGRTVLRAGPGTGIDPNSPEFKAAQEACQDLAPQGGEVSGAQNAELEKQVLAYAQCMRDNGVPDFPDPDVNGGRVQIRPGQGVDPNSPQFQQAQQACQEMLSGLGGGAP